MSERQMVRSIRDVEASHIARYLFAVPYIKDNYRVLDACCGVGYGTRFLSDMTRASQITGFDKSLEALSIARESFDATNIHYTLSSIEDLVAQDNYFDTITCFEAIEHVDDPVLLVDKLMKCLKVGGTLLLSTPNQDVLPFTKERYPEHVQHFTLVQIMRMVEGKAEVVGRFSQPAKFSTTINNHPIGSFMIIVLRKVRSNA